MIIVNGKILKIANNDLYGNVDEREVALFVAFNHKKYMNNYAVFTYATEYNKKKLYLASIHLKDNSLVTFNIKDKEIEYVNKFVDDYLNNKIDNNEYEIIDLSKINKVELVSYYEEDFDKLDELDKMSITHINDIDDNENNKRRYGFLYFLLGLLIILLVGITYLYFNPDILNVKLKKLECTQSTYNEKVQLKYISDTLLKFNRNDELVSFHKIDTYKFNDMESYSDFKDNNGESKYFEIDGAYKYDDDNLELKLIYDEHLIIYKYDEVLDYLKSNGYTCVEGTYDE